MIFSVIDLKIYQESGKRYRLPSMQTEIILSRTTVLTNRTYGPFKISIRILDNEDIYKFMVYTLLMNNFTILSTQTIANIG